MPPPTKGQTVARKRTRKRKRRVASSSSSSSSSGLDSDSDSHQVSVPVAKKPQPEPESSSEDSSSESDSESSRPHSPIPAAAEPRAVNVPPTKERSLSPSPPPPATIPSFLPSGVHLSQQEQALRSKFRKFWMASVADAFQSDLEEIRKEPGMTTSRLAILIDSLASGADVFTASTRGGDVNEMEVVLDAQGAT
ncbi:hypothetical protein BC835DRAFT_1414697 [Cytidiella melzeri]|nr:hypothetical protein BC835DRAFT_1414697 [Cytidiella melzeri]